MVAVGYGLSIVTPPTHEPIGIQEAREHVRLPASYTNYDGKLTGYIAAARQYAETATDRKLCTQTWDLFLDRFPRSDDPIYIPFGKCQSAVVTYTDTAGATQTWTSSDYVLSTSREPAVIRPTIGKTWPTPQNKPDAIKVRFVCGYGVSADVPREIKAAMLLLIGHFFAHAETEIVGSITSAMTIGADAIFQHYKLGDEFINYGTEVRVA